MSEPALTAKRGGQRGVPTGGPSVVRSQLAAITVSILAHATALAWITGYVLPAAARVRPAATVPPAAAPAGAQDPEPPPLLVELVDLDAAPRAMAPLPPAHAAASAPRTPAVDRTSDRTSDRAPPAPPTARSPSAAGNAALTVAHPPGGDGAAAAPGGPGKRSAMTMRSPSVDAGLSPGFVDDFLRHSKPVPPPPPELNTASHVNDVKIKELQAKVDSPLYHQIASADEIATTEMDLRSLQRERDNLTMKPIGGGRYRNEQESFRIDIAADGTVAIHDKPSIGLEGAGLRFDIEGAIMRSRGDDPYAPAKLRFLDRTRDERAELGRRNRTALLSRSAQLMRANIDWLWSMTRDPAKRREGLFDLWDECAETGEAELVAGADAARLMLIGEIRARLHGADAYTPEELARLNAHRRSTRRFAPYDETRPAHGAP